MHRQRSTTRAQRAAGVFVLAALSTGVLALAPPPAHAAVSVTAKLSGGVLRITGTDAAETVSIRLLANDASGIEVYAWSGGSQKSTIFPKNMVSAIDAQMLGGADSVGIDDAYGVFTTTIATTLSGGDGPDSIGGGAGPERIFGGRGNDLIQARRGDDVINTGPDQDTVLINGADGFDTVVDTGGNDATWVSGDGNDEGFTVAPNGSHVVVARDMGGKADLTAIENVRVLLGDGYDVVDVADLTGTGTKAVEIDASRASGSPLPDLTVDAINIHGTAGRDVVNAEFATAYASFKGLAASVSVRQFDPDDLISVKGKGGADAFRVPVMMQGRVEFQGDAGNDVTTLDGTTSNDTIPISGDETMGASFVRSGGSRVTARTESFVIDGGVGSDTISAADYSGTTTKVTLDGDVGSDTLTGSRRNDTILGGPGDDRAVGGPGNDTIQLGADNDTAFWTPTDGSDRVDGGVGTDTVSYLAGYDDNLIFLGPNPPPAGVAPVAITGARIQRFGGNESVDVAAVEAVTVLASTGSDSVGVGNLAGTGVRRVDVDLAGADPRSSDHENDYVFVYGTDAVDHIAVAPDAGRARVTGIAPTTYVAHPDSVDRLHVYTGAGNDTVTSTVPPTLLQVAVDPET